MDIGQMVAVGLSVLLGTWFLGGYIVNRGRSKAVESWLAPGLQSLGEAVKAPHSSAERVMFSIEKPTSPFRKVEVYYRLEARENLPLWVFNHIKGVRDELLVKAVLRKVPSLELEAGLSSDPQFIRWIEVLKRDGYQPVPSPDSYEILHRGPAKAEMLDCLRTLLDLYPNAKLRVSLRSKETHLAVRARLTVLEQQTAETFFSALTAFVKTDS